MSSKYLPAWFLGTFPDKRVILASYEAEFAASWGAKAKEVLREHGGLFGVGISTDSSAKAHWDIAGRRGGMQTAGVGGPITGKGADLLIIDDPIKNNEDAASQTIRDKNWEWWLSTSYTRLEPDAAVIVIQTRWHEDDLTGRMLSHEESSGDPWRKMILPAIGDDGAALWPERYSVKDLERIKRNIGSYWWSALYQQRPAPEDGLIFKRHWFGIVPEAPAQVTKAVRYWDKAGTDSGGDYSVGCLIAERDGLFYVVDVVRGQWSSMERNKIIQQTAEIDATRYGGKMTTWVEQEPGSGGKESAELTIRQLAGFYVKSERVTGEKTTRWRPLSAQCEGGNVKLVKAKWNATFIDELCIAPNGTHDDQADAASGAFNKLAMKRQFVVGIA